MIKDLLVNLKLGGPSDPAANYAASIASTFGAHVAGVAFAYDPVIPVTIMGGMPIDIIDAQRTENEKAAQAAIARFDALVKRNALSAETRMHNATIGGASDILGRMARRFDLSVIGQVEPDSAPAEELLIEGALFGSGRPVIVVPYIQKEGLKLGRVTCCWDGSRAAARAIADAMPFLTRAKNVDILIVSTAKAQANELPGADLGQHLARHNIKVEVKTVPAGDVDVPDVILSHIADTSTDLLVMGGYGHSRLREFVLGGATRAILSSMTAPTLLSH